MYTANFAINLREKINFLRIKKARVEMSNVNKSSYNKIAKLFTESRSKAGVSNLVKKFAKVLDNGDSVLDVGCGCGLPNTKFLAKQRFDITGIDISEELLAEAIKNVPGGRFLLVDIMSFNSNQKFKGIIAWDSLFHLRLKEHESAFKRLYMLLENNGYLLFTHGGGLGGQISGKMYGQEFTYSTLGPAETKKLLIGLGFEVLKWEVDNTGNGYMIGLVKKRVPSTSKS